LSACPVLLLALGLVAVVSGAEVVAGTASAMPADAAAAVAEGDRAWDERAASLEGRRARPEAIERAIADHRRAIEVAAASGAPALEARWKALRAAHFLSEFTTASETRRAEAIADATRLSDESLERISRASKERDLVELEGSELDVWLEETGHARLDVAQLHFWSAIVWGAHGQRVGLLTIVRQGVANRMYDDARLALRLEPTIERGGAHRLLSRLHADLPRVPFISGWVDRDRALPHAEQAFEIAPGDPGNQLILAMAIRDFAPERLDEAEALLEQVVRAEPRPELRAEDLAILEEAKEVLEALRERED
jgi:hypothetical protein